MEVETVDKIKIVARITNYLCKSPDTVPNTYYVLTHIPHHY